MICIIIPLFWATHFVLTASCAMRKSLSMIFLSGRGLTMWKDVSILMLISICYIPSLKSVNNISSPALQKKVLLSIYRYSCHLKKMLVNMVCCMLSSLSLTYETTVFYFCSILSSYKGPLLTYCFPWVLFWSVLFYQWVTSSSSISLMHTLMWHTFLPHSERQTYIFNQLLLIYSLKKNFSTTVKSHFPGAATPYPMGPCRALLSSCLSSCLSSFSLSPEVVTTFCPCSSFILQNYFSKV